MAKPKVRENLFDAETCLMSAFRDVKLAVAGREHSRTLLECCHPGWITPSFLANAANHALCRPPPSLGCT